MSTNNVILGINSAKNSMCSVNNTIIGNSAGQFNTSGCDNVFIGNNSGRFNTNTRQNTFVGTESGNYSNGDTNTYIGYKSGSNIEGNTNIIIGNSFSTNTTQGLNNNVIIGNNMQSNTDNIIKIGNNNTSLLTGNITSKNLVFDSNCNVNGQLLAESLIMNVKSNINHITNPVDGQIQFIVSPNGTLNFYIRYNNTWNSLLQSTV